MLLCPPVRSGRTWETCPVGDSSLSFASLVWWWDGIDFSVCSASGTWANIPACFSDCQQHVYVDADWLICMYRISVPACFQMLYCMHIPVHLRVHPSLRPSFSPSLPPSIHASIYLCIHLPCYPEPYQSSIAVFRSPAPAPSA